MQSSCHPETAAFNAQKLELVISNEHCLANAEKKFLLSLTGHLNVLQFQTNENAATVNQSKRTEVIIWCE